MYIQAKLASTSCPRWKLSVHSLLPRVTRKASSGPQAAQFRSVQSLSRVRPFANPWIAAHQASLSITNSWSLLKLMSIKSVMPSNHLILCHPLLLLPSIFPSIRAFSKESALRIRWPKDWSFSFSISPSSPLLNPPSLSVFHSTTVTGKLLCDLAGQNTS